MTPFVIKRNDTWPSLEAQLLDGTGSPIDLTGCTVRFLMSPADGGIVAPVSGLCEIVNASQGIVRYRWKPGDTSTAGKHYGEFEITFPDGNVHTVPSDGYISVVIVEDLG